ncbi:MAG: hypothetical protein JW751_04910 [Polyangiaceae bacterium]|nr:hypothetical protein [Polyangiaceae bacterium]
MRTAERRSLAEDKLHRLSPRVADRVLSSIDATELRCTVALLRSCRNGITVFGVALLCAACGGKTDEDGRQSASGGRGRATGGISAAGSENTGGTSAAAGREDTGGAEPTGGGQTLGGSTLGGSAGAPATGGSSAGGAPTGGTAGSSSGAAGGTAGTTGGALGGGAGTAGATSGGTGGPVSGGAGGVGGVGQDPSCGFLGDTCCPDEECYGIEVVCGRDALCVACGRRGEECCTELQRRVRPGEPGRLLCTNYGDACDDDGFCVACGGEGDPCCTNNRCDGGGCCVGGACVADGATCGDGGTCMTGACSHCGGAEGEPCCDGSCGSNLACDGTDRCVCGGEGEPCCGTTCDSEAMGCFGYVCQPGTDECPPGRPIEGGDCNHFGPGYCVYPNGPSNVLCSCNLDGWSCIA